MEVKNGQLKAGTGKNMMISHNTSHRIMVMMLIEEVDTEGEVVDVDLEEGSEEVEVVATTRMGTVVVMVVTMVATEEVVVETVTEAVVMDTEAREVDVVASEDKMVANVVDLEADEVVTEVTAVMVDIIEDSEVGNSINK